MKGGSGYTMPVPSDNDIKKYGDYDAYLKNAIYSNKVSTVTQINYI